MWFIFQYASLGLLLVLVSVLIYLLARHVKIRGQMEFYRAQGVHAPPGYNRPIIGNYPEFRAVTRYCHSLIGTEKPSPKVQIAAALDETTESKLMDSYDYSKNTVSILNIGYPLLIVSDPEIVQEMMVSKNNFIDKSFSTSQAWKNLLGASFLFSPGDEKWQSKRKGLAHAFFKDRLIAMQEKFKEYTSQAQKRWMDKIHESEKGFAKVDMTREILQILN